MAAYVPPDWDGALKKQQLTRRGGRQRGGGARGKDGGGGGEEGTFVRLRLFGREVLPAHLSARLPAVQHTHKCARGWRGTHKNVNT